MNNADFNNKLRLGYSLINANGSPGTAISRSVKLFGSDTTADATNKANFYSFLYSISPNGGTPLHSAIDVVADYYKTRSPWLKNPDSAYNVTTNPELYCKRSFDILFSDGAWNGLSSVTTDFDNTAGSTFTRYTAANTTAVTPASLAYSPTGNTDRALYTPFGSESTKGLADLTAGYYWHEDFRTGANNGVPTQKRKDATDLEPRSPTFWQNMTTYTIGYGIRPSGELPTDHVDYNANGLTFAKIQKYQKDYFTQGATATKPPWPSVALTSNGSEQNNVDDFIQAGFTGGGFGASVNTPAEVRAVFSKIVNGILEAIGNDAGVAASAGSGAFNDYAGLLKYETKYSTKNNTGDIEAYKLDASGNKVDASAPDWKASSQLPAANKRNIYAMSGTKSPFPFTGAYSSMNPDVRTALNPNNDASFPTDDRFINYMRGVDPILDNNNIALRTRDEKLAASVNSPPAYVGGRVDNAFDLNGTVDGSSKYFAYMEKKRSYPASLMEATNAGMVHVLEATTGKEMAAFMPRNAMTKLWSSYANTAYDFQYVLDGVLAEQDIYNTTLTTPAWNHVVVGTGGRGGKFAFALRSPLNTTIDRQPTKDDFLWEIGESNIRATDTTNGGVNMGYMTQNARMGQTYNGEWVTLVNNGHYSNGTSGLIVVNAITGEHIRSIPLPTGSSNDPGRGLSGATLIHDANRRIVGAYAGDANGHLWRFSLLGTPSQWEVSYGRPLFTDPAGKPIYGAPAWQNHPKGGTIVMFATGMLMDDTDLADITTKSIFGIWDPILVGSKLNTNKLLDLEKSTYSLLQQTVSATAGVNQTTTKVPLYTVSKNTIDWTKHKGWQLKLGQITDYPTVGERVIGDAANLGSSVMISSVVRSNSAASDAEVCEATAGNPPNFTYIVDALSGGGKRSYDANDDGKADDYSVAYFATGGFARNTDLNIKTIDYYTTAMLASDPGKALRIKFSAGNNESIVPQAPSIPAKCKADFGIACDVDPPAYTATPCGTEGATLGLSGGAKVYDGCVPASSWKRSWRQVISPPN
jgi:type IV pilus assembly protein PilY1